MSFIKKLFKKNYASLEEDKVCDHCKHDATFLKCCDDCDKKIICKFCYSVEQKVLCLECETKYDNWANSLIQESAKQKKNKTYFDNYSDYEAGNNPLNEGLLL